MPVYLALMEEMHPVLKMWEEREAVVVYHNGQGWRFYTVIAGLCCRSVFLCQVLYNSSADLNGTFINNTLKKNKPYFLDI